jgi:hypothetical protein
VPASTIEEATAALRAPFPPGVEQYRVGPTWEQGGERWTRPLAYIDARAVFARLDEAVGPGNWHTELERLGPGVYLCRLTLFGCVRCDVGQAGDNEGEKEKSGVSDAIKRAAVQYGLGAYLYDQELPPVKLEQRGREWVLPRNWRPTGRAAAPATERPTADTATPRTTASSATLATAKQIAKIGVEMARLGWSDERGREYVQATFGKQSRRELTAAEASAFIETLVSLTDRVRAG